MSETVIILFGLVNLCIGIWALLVLQEVKLLLKQVQKFLPNLARNQTSLVNGLLDTYHLVKEGKVSSNSEARNKIVSQIVSQMNGKGHEEE